MQHGRGVWRGALALYFLLLAGLALVRIASAYALEHHPWIMGDWLIHYGAGFVRRGLLGTLTLALGTRWADPGLFAALFIAGTYLTFLAFTYLAWQRQPALEPYALFLWAPFLFWFPVLDVQGAYRKEILFLALLAGVVYFVGRNPRGATRPLTGALLLFPWLLLSHEALLAYLPYVGLVALWAARQGWRGRPKARWAGLLALSLLAWVAALTHRGTAAQERAILAQLRAAGYPITARDNAIVWLDVTVEEQLAVQLPRMRQVKPLLRILAFGPWVGLAFVPVLPRLRPWRRDPRAWALFAASVGMTVVLMAVAKDWGRFWYVHGVSLFLLTLLDARPLPWQVEPARLRWLLWALGPLYAAFAYWHHVHGFSWYRPNLEAFLTKRALQYLDMARGVLRYWQTHFPH